MADSSNGAIIHQWTFTEFPHHSHSRLWRVLVGLFVVCAVALNVWYGNITFAFLIIIFGIILLMREVQGPELMRVRICDGALELIFDHHHQRDLPATTTIPWENVSRFWIAYRPPHTKTLYFEFNTFFRRRLAVPLKEENPVEIRETLKQFAQEDLSKTSEPFMDIVSRILKI